MKYLLTIGLTLLLTFNSDGQACGKYRIGFSGTLDSSLQVTRLIIPSTEVFHGHEQQDLTNSEFIYEITPNKESFELKTWSHLTSQLFRDPNELLDYYKRQLDFFPVFLTILEEGQERTSELQVSWNDITVTVETDDEPVNIFMVNIGLIGK